MAQIGSRRQHRRRRRVKWLGHYSSAQTILVVGDGDLSFSLALAAAFGSGHNLVATSLDSYDALTSKYGKAESNVTDLERLGAVVLHGIDAKTMKWHPCLKTRRFDRMVFNFPHAGFIGCEKQDYMINAHQLLVRSFFRNASHLLCPDGEIHISHKTGQPYDRWEIKELAYEFSLVVFEMVAFRKEDYPGYNQKRGDGERCDEEFSLHNGFTFKFCVEYEEAEECVQKCYSTHSMANQSSESSPSMVVHQVWRAKSPSADISESNKQEEKNTSADTIKIGTKELELKELGEGPIVIGNQGNYNGGIATVQQGPMANDHDASTSKSKPRDPKYIQPNWCPPGLSKTKKRGLQRRRNQQKVEQDVEKQMDESGAVLAAPSFPASILQTVDIRQHVLVTLDLAAGNYAQWRRFFDAVIGMFGLRSHLDADFVAPLDNPDWAMVDHYVVHWLYTTISPALLEIVMQPEDTAAAVWAAILGIFHDNQLSRAVYVDAEYHACVQGDLTVLEYCTRLKRFADQLRDLGQPISESQQVFNLLRGLGRQFHGAIPHITSQARSFLMLEEFRAEQAVRQQSADALLAGRAGGSVPSSPGASSSGTAPGTSPTSGRNRNRHRGRGNGGGGGSSSSMAPPAPHNPAYLTPAPGANSWTGLGQAWPVPWRAPGAGVLGPRPGVPHQQAMMAAPMAPPPLGYTYGYAPGFNPVGYGAAPTVYAPGFIPGASTSAAPRPWDMGALQSVLQHSALSPPSGSTSDWVVDTGASAHMTSNAGHPHSGSDSAM